MDHAQFEMLVAAILTSGLAGAGGVREPQAIVSLLAEVHKEITTREAITKQSANFIPKGR
jgi:hypothetical protein